MRYANLFGSYLDRSKTLRTAKIFDKDFKEIYEIVADCIKNNISTIDVEQLKKSNENLANKLHAIGVVRYITKHVEQDDKIQSKDYKFVVYDKNNGKILTSLSKDENLEELEEKLRNSNFPEIKEKLSDLTWLYEYSRNVYTTMYNFLSSNGRLDDALKVHCRKEEVYRKYLKEGISKNASLLIDIAKNIILFIISLFLKWFTNYGVGVGRTILLLAILLIIESGYLQSYLQLDVLNNLHIENLKGIAEAIAISLVVFTITFRLSR